MGSIRKPSLGEEKLIEFLAKKGSVKLLWNWKDNLLVKPMNDDGMGSLLLLPEGSIVENRLFGSSVSEYHFNDKDDVKVIVSLNLDNKGRLFELDIWKTDYSPLVSIPKDLPRQT